MEVDQLYLGMQVCAQSDLLALLPDVVVTRSALAGALRRLPVELPTRVPLFFVRRQPQRSDTLIETVAAALVKAIERPGGHDRRSLP